MAHTSAASSAATKGRGPRIWAEALVRETATSKANRARVSALLANAIGAASAPFYGPGLRHPATAREHEAMVAASVEEQAAIQAALGILGPGGLLDSRRLTRLIDRSGMLDRLGRWPVHVRTMVREAARAASEFRRLHPQAGIERVCIYGLGGSGAPHDIARDAILNFRKSAADIAVAHADAPNPDSVTPRTLAVFSSFSGNTEETLNCLDVVGPRTPLRAAIAKGGKLRELAHRRGIPFIQLPEKSSHPAFVMQPRESACLQLTAMLTFLARVGLAPGSAGSLSVDDLALDAATALLDRARKRFGPRVPFARNSAKQLAFFLLYGIRYTGRGKLPAYDLWDKKIPFVLADRNNAALGHEVRTQIHERSKLNAAFYEAPEFLHNLVESVRAGAASSRAGLDPDRYVHYFVRSRDEEPRIRLRLDETIERVMRGNASYAIFEAEGDNPFHRALFATCFNAHMTTYLAILNGFDPLPVPTMSWMKNVMDGLRRGGKRERSACVRRRPGLEMHPVRA